jgi:hypothetical protein
MMAGGHTDLEMGRDVAATPFRAPGTFIAIAFDPDGRVVERSVAFGQFGQVARDLYIASTTPRRGYELAGALIVKPSLSPEEVSSLLRDALALKLPAELGKFIEPHWSGQWVSTLRGRV